jgi:hypothetical protein
MARLAIFQGAMAGANVTSGADAGAQDSPVIYRLKRLVVSTWSLFLWEL